MASSSKPQLQVGQELIFHHLATICRTQWCDFTATCTSSLLYPSDHIVKMTLCSGQSIAVLVFTGTNSHLRPQPLALSTSVDCYLACEETAIVMPVLTSVDHQQQCVCEMRVLWLDDDSQVFWFFQALICTAINFPVSGFRRLLQSNAATTVLDFQPSADSQPPRVTLDRLNQV